MKLVTFICVLFFALSVNAQTQYPRGLPSPSSNGYIREGYTQIDSGIITNVRDTFLAKYPTLIKWSGNNKYYYTNGNGTAWYPLVINPTIFSINAGWGLIKVNDSTLKVDTSINGVATWALLKKKIDSIGVLKVNYTDTASMLSHYVRTGTAGTGTVTSVATNTGSGIKGGTITSTGTIAADTIILATRLRVQKAIDSVNANVTLRVKYSDTAFMLSPYLRSLNSMALYQPLENQRLSTSNNVQFVDATTTGKISSTGEIYSNTKLKTVGNVELTADNTGLSNTASGFTFKAQASNSGWYTPNNLLANAFVKIGGTSSQFLMADGSTTSTTLASGTYTPTIGLISNASASTARVCQYMRVGSVVTVSGYVSVTSTSTGTSTRITMTLPVSSTFSGSGNAGGSGGIPGAGASLSSAVIFSNTSASTVSMDFVPYATGSSDIWFTFTYQII